MNNVFDGFDKLLDGLFAHMLKILKKRLEERIQAEIDNKDKKLDVRTADICLAIIDGEIDDMLNEEE